MRRDWRARCWVRAATMGCPRLPIEGGVMATVIMHAVVSVDGFIADDNDDVGPLFEWYFNGDRPIVEDTAEGRHAPFRVSEPSQEYVRPFWDSLGATIQGRHLFDLTNG